MKRYWLFIYHDFYPDGGMGDFRGQFDNMEKIEEYMSKFEEELSKNCEVLDTSSGIVYDYTLGVKLYQVDNF